MRFGCFFISVAMMLGGTAATRADDFIHRMEGDEFPDQMADPWPLFDDCDNPENDCIETLEDGILQVTWFGGGGDIGYTYIVSPFPDPAPASFWVEARFASNEPLSISPFCDATLSVGVGGVSEAFVLLGDAVFDFSLTFGRAGLSLDDFRTLRFESPDGVHFSLAVDGDAFLRSPDKAMGISTFVSIYSDGACSANPTINRWDYVRFGTLSSGERVIATDPPSGFIDPRSSEGFDRFAVTFDAPNYSHNDEIIVSSIGGAAPEVIATRRRGTDGPETFEVVLDRPLSTFGQTRFVFDDGTIQNVVDFSFIRGDSSGDGAIDLRDFRDLQQCFGQTAGHGCSAFDFDWDGTINTGDAASFLPALTPPRD